MKFHYLFIFSFLFSGTALSAQFFHDVNQSVKMSAEVSDFPPAIIIHWVEDEGVVGYDFYRRLYGTNTGWGTKLATFQPGVTQYVDENVVLEQLYEYKIVKRLASNETGYGYVLSGIQLPPVHYRGEVMLLITSTTLFEIEAALAEYRAAVAADGWTSQLLVIEPNQSVSAIKSDLVEAYENRPFSAIFILGDVPVPHSGDINPDAHPNHKGAWAADLYYGDLDGIWTDSFVTNTSALTPINHNVPGDEKWDQSYLPSDVEVAVGRADFSDLPVFTDNEYDLLRNYLRKDIDFRAKQFSVSQRAAIRNTNPWDGGLGQNGIRNFSALVGPQNITYNTWEDVFVNDYLWYYGSGGGSQTSAVQLGSSQTYANSDFRAVFTAWFGSYFGDYDFPDNYLRSTLGSGYVLTAVWAGAPHWHFHAMGMGFPMAHVTALTQNNDTLYTAGYFPRGVHVNLLGDPTLAAYPVSPPSSLIYTDYPDYNELTWVPSPDQISHYYVYRRTANELIYTLIDSTDNSTTHYQDTDAPLVGEVSYLIRAAKLEITPSGSFFDLSIGAASSYLSRIAEVIAPEVSIYPNPASSWLKITASRRIESLKLTDLQGRLLKTQSPHQPTAELNVGELPTGFYILRVDTGGRIVNQRVFVQHQRH